MMSMARGFVYAGCPSIVISLWKLDDKSAAQVMGRFYYHLSEGERIDESLSNAKTDFLAFGNEFKSHPAYWASFLSFGETAPIKTNGPGLWGWVLVVLVISVVSFALFKGSYHRREHNSQ